MSDTMRNRLIAKVIEIGVLDNFGSPGTTPSRDSAEEIVDAVLAEMREPTKDMLKIGQWATIDEYGSMRDLAGVRDDLIRAAFTAMIDHIRAGK